MQTSIDDLGPAVPPARRMASSGRWSRMAIVPVLVVAILAIGLVTQPSGPASAAAEPVAQCNDDTASNVGGQGIACTVTIINHVDSTGGATAPSEVTVTTCTGAAGPIAAGAGTCSTTTTTSAEPITLVQQCNGSANGGGGVVICTVQVTNSFGSRPTAEPGAATVYQCVGSEISGPGAPAICTPDNTPGVTSVGAATVGQCNGSGNGGTSVGFICTVGGASTMTSALAVNVDQCNGSANGGGSLVRCTATVTNEVLGSTATATLTATLTASATSSGTPIATATSTTPSGTATPVSSGTPTAPASGTGTPAAPGATITPPLPPATGNAGHVEPGPGSQSPVWLLGFATIGAVVGFMVAERRFASRRSR